MIVCDLCGSGDIDYTDKAYTIHLYDHHDDPTIASYPCTKES